jgi:hypothetical protein
MLKGVYLNNTQSQSHPQETVSQVRSWFDKPPRTDHGKLKVNYLAVRPEHVEGRTANYDTVS